MHEGLNQVKDELISEGLPGSEITQAEEGHVYPT